MSYTFQHSPSLKPIVTSLLRKASNLLFLLVVLCGGVSAQNCGDTVYDPGGTGTYPSNANWSQTFTGGASDILSITFLSFQVESGYDYLYVYDGPSTGSPLLAQLSGSTVPNDIVATGNQITLRFTSDGSVEQDGFELQIICNSPPEPSPCASSECVEEYSFNWYDGTSGAEWPITNGEATWSEVYTISGGQGDYMVTVTLDNSDGQNIDFSNCTVVPDAAYTATCNDPNGNMECDGDPNTTDSQFTYGCTFLTFGVTSTTSDQVTSITYDLEHPAFICDFEIGDIDFSPASNPNLTSYQDEVDVVADSMGVPVVLSAVTGSAVDVINNNTSSIKLLADYDNASGGDVLPTDPRGRANITSETRVTSITFTYSNGPEDDGLSDDHAIRLSGFTFCPEVVEICDNDLDDDGNGYADSFDPACPTYAPFNCDKQLYQSIAATSTSDYFLYSVQTDPVNISQISNLSNNGMDASAFNSLAFNPVDRFLYGINPVDGTDNEMYRINNLGEVEYIGNITGLSGNNEAGCMSATGQYYVTGGSGSLYIIDIETLQATLITNLGFTGFDLAISPADNMLYIWDSENNRLKSIDPVSGAVTEVGPSNTQYAILGALYFNEQGEIIAYGDDVNVTTTVQETLMKIDPTTGVITPLGTGPATNYNDGCSCAFGVGFDKGVSATVANGGEEITYTFTIYNNTGSALTDVSFSDVLPSGFVWSGEPFDVVGLTLNSTSVTNQQAANFQIASIPTGSNNSFKLTTTIPVGFCGELGNQAQLSALPSSLGSSVVSDDPATAAISDFTITAVNDCLNYFLEVECGVVGSNWNEIQDVTVSGGRYLTINPPANSYNVAPSSPDDQISIDVEVAFAGSYNLFARVQGDNGADDSFWFRANGGTWIKWNSWASLASSWTWLHVYNTDNGNSLVQLDLSAGTNTIEIAYREDGANIDKIALSISDDVPTGLGDQGINCPEICGNGIDDDLDGLTDCEDDDCIGEEICEGPCPTGGLRVERWMNISGTDISTMTDLATYPDSPDEAELIYSFDAPNSIADNYGQRISGYIIPSETGVYTFNVTGDDNCEVYLGTSVDPSSTVLIADIPGWTSQGQHDKYPSQTSVEITLTAGQWYYVELLHKEGGGGDNAELYWKTPSNGNWTIIPGANLSPSSCIEICDNGIDDDLDGLSDCDDPDCASSSVAVTAESSSAEICFGESVSLSANISGPVTGYAWSNSAGNTQTVSVSPSTTTTYTVTVSNSGGCTATDNVQVVVNDPPFASAYNDGPITCTDGTVTVTADPAGMSYVWSDGGTAQSNNVTTAGTYIVTVTDSNGCTSTAQTVVSTDLTPPAVNAGLDDMVCNGQSITLTASGAMSYLWNTGSTAASITVSPSSNTTYTVTGRAANGCTATDDVVVTVNSNPVVDAVSSQPLTCDALEVPVSVTGHNICSTYFLSGTIDGSRDRGGSNLLNRDFVFGDDYAFNVDFDNPTEVTIETTIGDRNIGRAGTVTIDGIAEAINTPNNVFQTVEHSPSISDTYAIELAGLDLSMTSVVFKARSGEVLSAFDFGTATSPLQAGYVRVHETSTSATACNGNTYSWSVPAGASNPGDVATFNVSTTGTYIVTVTDGLGCSGTAQTVVTSDYSTPSANAGSDQLICDGDNATLSASGGVSYEWSTGATTSDVTVTPVAMTSYTVTVTGANGCTASDVVTVDIRTIDGGLISGDEISCTGYVAETIKSYQEPQLSSGTYTYKWQVSTDNLSWNDIPGATMATFSPGSVSATRYFRRVVVDNICGETYSNVIGKVVDPGLEICPDAEDFAFDCDSGYGVSPAGTGIEGIAAPALRVLNPTFFEYYIVEAVFSGGAGSPDQVSFRNREGDTKIVNKRYFDGELGAEGTRYFKAILPPSDSIFLEHNGDASLGESFVVYTVRPSSNYASFGHQVHQEIAPGEDYAVSFPIDPSINSKTMFANVQLAGIVNDGSEVSIRVFADGMSDTTIVTAPNYNNTLSLEYINVDNINPDADSIHFVIESPAANGQTALLSGYIGGLVYCDQNLVITASTDGECVREGDVITYTYTLYNFADVEFTNLNATSSLGGSIDFGVDVIPPNSQLVITQDITITADMINNPPLVNNVVVSGFNFAEFGIKPKSDGFVDDLVICEICDDGIDNDEDGLTDCNDPDCIDGIDIIDISASADEICLGESTTISVSTSGAIAYQWDASGPQSVIVDDLVTMTVSPTVTSTYSITVTNSGGCTAVDDIEIVVHTPPSASSSNDGPITCDDITVTVSAEPSGLSYLWSDGSVTQNTDVTSEGVYTVTVTDGNGCTDVSSTTVALTPDPVIILTGPSEICIGETTSFSPTSGGDWTSSDDDIAIISNNGNVVGVSGGFAVFTFRESLTGCSSVSDTIFVSPEMDIVIDFMGGVCLTDDSQLGVDITGGTPAYTYTWEGPSSFTSTDAVIDITESGNYYVTVTDAFGCEESTSGYLYERYDPFIFSLSTEVCEGETVDLNVNSSTAVAYLWSTNAGSNTTSSVTVTPSPPSTMYSVTITNDLGCESVASVTIDVNEKTNVAVTGPSTICQGETTALSPTTGGTWTSSNNNIATVSPDGIVTGVSYGSVSFVFIDDVYLCSSDPTTSVTIVDLPDAVYTGSTVLCEGETTSLSPTSGGVWTSSDPNVATVTDDGQVLAVGSGTASFTFENTSTGCVSDASADLTIHTVYPVEITGDTNLCAGENTFLTPTSGGTWSSSDTDVATISNIGVVTAVSGGTASFTFTSDYSCISPESQQITVTDITDMMISGPTEICQGTSALLSVDVAGGVWSTSNGSILAVDANTGEITGLAEGGATITYAQDPELCINDATYEIIILAKPQVNLTGSTSLCVGDISNVSSTISGGTWTSTDDLVAVISDAGVVVGVSAGQAAFIYEAANGCFSDTTAYVTVHPEITVDISYNGGLCLEDDTQLTAEVTGGTADFDYLWTGPGGFVSNNITIDVPLSGNYTVVVTDDVGCSAEYSAFVYSRYEPFIFTLNTEVCEGESVTLSINGSNGGTYQWSDNAGNSTLQTITVTPPVPSATYAVTVTNDIGCTTLATATIDVNPTPDIDITGNDAICIGTVTTLTASTPGTWTSSDYSVANINNNGVVTGVGFGTAVFTFRDDASGCYSDASEVISVAANAPININGDDDICIGIPKVLTATESGGTWYSSNESIATIDSGTGEVTPVAAGSVTITYVMPPGECFTDGEKSISVRNLPSVNINGPSLICEGDNTYLIPSSGGTWVSDDETVATVSNIGVVTGVSGGVTSFTFTSVYGCISDLGQDVTVVAEPIITASGPTSLCINESTQLSANTSGIWISSNNQVASVSSQGLVLAKKAGTADFTFIEFTNGCEAGTPITITVNPVPSINGLNDQAICVGETTSITPSTGGTWSSSDPQVATITDGGVVTAVSPGAATFTYVSSTTGCESASSAALTVEGLPSINTVGPTEICVGDGTNVQPSSGGIWSSSDVSIATISNQGVITGVSNGEVRFIFTNTSTGCTSDQTEVFTVTNPTPASISGETSMCMTDTQMFTASESGSWSSSNSEIASVNAAGMITAVAPGLVTITLTPFDDCVAVPTLDIQVIPLPTAMFLGASSVCINSTTNLSPLSGGVWISNNPTVATVTDAGIVTALSAGEALFTYTDTLSGCSATTTTSLLVFDRPAIEISGDDEICIGGSTSMSPSTGGFWTSSDEAVANISTAGLITGVSAGVVSFTYTESGTGCISQPSQPVTILPKPIVSVTGDNQICPGGNTQLAPSSGGGWISDNTDVATVSESGLVTGISQGIARFTFVSDAGCPSNKTSPVVVFGAPTIFVPETSICIGEENFASPSTGGSWSSSDPSIATITDGGLITGISPGSVTFTFIDSASGCASPESDPVTVSANPDISVLGPAIICAGSTTNLVPTTGGVWISLNTDIATINNGGTVTGVGTGQARFLFTDLSTGCTSDTSSFVTVIESLVPSYAGPTAICIGDTTYLETLTAGTWSSNNMNVATINNDGTILSVGQGVAQFRFTNESTGCISEWSAFLTVNGAPTVSIDGPSSICAGSSTELASTVAGTWEGLNNDIASVTADGTVTGVSPGDAYFRFTDAATGCTTDGSLLVAVQDGDVVTLTGDAEICAGYTTTIEPSTGGFWSSSNPAIASITNGGVITGRAGGQVTFTFTNSSTGCITHAVDDPVTVGHCRNHDFNVSLVNQSIFGSIETNDNMPSGSTYSAFYQTVESPEGSIVSLVIASDGGYSFSGNLPGNYLFKTPVCGPSQSSGCPTTLLEITVVDDVYSAANPVANIDIGTTYNYDLSAAGRGSDLPGQSMPVNIMANDKCVYTVGCDMDYSTISVLIPPSNGTTTTDALGNIWYIPVPGYIGYDTIMYQTCSDDGLRCNKSWQMLSVNDTTAHNSIVAGDDFTYTIVGIPTSGNVLTNDSDPEWDVLSVVPQGSLIAPISTPDGLFHIDSGGDYTFTPSAGFAGHTEVIYTVCDAMGNCTDATIHMLVFDDISINIRLYVEGALMRNGGQIGPDGRPLMRDDLRVSPYTAMMAIPLDDPYTTPFNFTYLYDRYSHLGPHLFMENQKIVDSLAVFSVTGADAIVDWVHIELRSKSDSTFAIASRAGLLQRDGDVVDLDGVSPLRFQGVNVDSFYVVAKHRSHLGVMSEKVHFADLVDFTDLDFPLWDYGDTHENGFDYTGLSTKNTVMTGYRALWCGDMDSNGKIKFSAPEDDQTYIFQDVLFTSPAFLINYDNTIGYYSGDYDMNSKAKYTNPNDDKNLLFSQILLYPLNTYFVSNFNAMIEQVPTRSN